MKNPPWPLSIFQYCPRCGSRDGSAVDIKHFVCRDCGFELYSNAGAAVIGILPNEHAELLFTRRGRDPGRGKLDLPGGFVDPLESAETALRREVDEEVGIRIETMEYLASFSNRYDYRDVTYYTLDMVFVCTAPDLTIHFDHDEVTGASFHDPYTVRARDFGLESAWDAVNAYLSRSVPSITPIPRRDNRTKPP